MIIWRIVIIRVVSIIWERSTSWRIRIRRICWFIFFISWWLIIVRWFRSAWFISLIINRMVTFCWTYWCFWLICLLVFTIFNSYSQDTVSFRNACWTINCRISMWFKTITRYRIIIYIKVLVWQFSTVLIAYVYQAFTRFIPNPVTLIRHLRKNFCSIICIHLDKEAWSPCWFILSTGNSTTVSHVRSYQKSIWWAFNRNRIVRIGRCTPVSWYRGCQNHTWAIKWTIFSSEAVWYESKHDNVITDSFTRCYSTFSIRRFVDTWSSEEVILATHLNNTWTFYFISNQVASNKWCVKFSYRWIFLIIIKFQDTDRTICPWCKVVKVFIINNIEEWLKVKGVISSIVWPFVNLFFALVVFVTCIWFENKVAATVIFNDVWVTKTVVICTVWISIVVVVIVESTHEFWITLIMIVIPTKENVVIFNWLDNNFIVFNS